MKISIEIHETAKRKPTNKDAVGGDVIVYYRDSRCWILREAGFVNSVDMPLWFSPRSLPKPPPLRKRKEKG